MRWHAVLTANLLFMTNACDEFDSVQIHSKVFPLFMPSSHDLFSAAIILFGATTNYTNFTSCKYISHWQILFPSIWYLLCLLYLHVIYKRRKRERERSRVTVMALPNLVAMTRFHRHSLRTLYERFFECRRYIRLWFERTLRLRTYLDSWARTQQYIYNETKYQPASIYFHNKIWMNGTDR